MANKQKEEPKTVKVNKNMTFADVLTKYPESWEVMQNCGLHCIGCHGAAFETIEQGSLMHGMSEEDVDKMVDEINKKIGGSGNTGNTSSRNTENTNPKKEAKKAPSAKPKKTVGKK